MEQKCYSVEGIIRSNSLITSEEFAKLLARMGLEFHGTYRESTTTFSAKREKENFLIDENDDAKLSLAVDDFHRSFMESVLPPTLLSKNFEMAKK